MLFLETVCVPNVLFLETPSSESCENGGSLNSNDNDGDERRGEEPPFRQNHAIPGHGIAWIFPPTLVEFPKEERVQFLFVCVAPIPLISVLLLRCATVEFLKVCFQPPQGGHAMKQQAKRHCDHSACEHRQTSLWDSVNCGNV